MSNVLGIDQDLFTDSSITLSATVDTDLSNASAIRFFLVDRSGNSVQWGSDQSGVAKGETVSASDEPENLTLDGESVGAGRYWVQVKYEDSDGDVDTISETQIAFKEAK